MSLRIARPTTPCPVPGHDHPAPVPLDLEQARRYVEEHVGPDPAMRELIAQRIAESSSTAPPNPHCQRCTRAPASGSDFCALHAPGRWQAGYDGGAEWAAEASPVEILDAARLGQHIGQDDLDLLEIHPGTPLAELWTRLLGLAPGDRIMVDRRDDALHGFAAGVGDTLGQPLPR